MQPMVPSGFSSHFADNPDTLTPPPYSIAPVAMGADSSQHLRGAPITGSHSHRFQPMILASREKPSLKWGILIALTGAVLGSLLGIGMDAKRQARAAASQAQTPMVVVAQPVPQPPVVTARPANVAATPAVHAPAAAPVAPAAAPVTVAAPAAPPATEPSQPANVIPAQPAVVVSTAPAAPPRHRSWSRPAPAPARGRVAKAEVAETAAPAPAAPAKVAVVAVAETKPEPKKAVIAEPTKPEPKKAVIAEPEAKKPAAPEPKTAPKPAVKQSDAEKVLADAIKDTANTL